MRFLADENFNNDLLHALQSQNPDIDILRVQDTEMVHADDPTLLEWAAKEERILLTYDVRTIPKFAYARITAGLPMPGVIEVKRNIPFAKILSDLLILFEAGTPADFENRVWFVPIR